MQSTIKELPKLAKEPYFQLRALANHLDILNDKLEIISYFTTTLGDSACIYLRVNNTSIGAVNFNLMFSCINMSQMVFLGVEVWEGLLWYKCLLKIDRLRTVELIRCN